jgi:hypothetical protein
MELAMNRHYRSHVAAQQIEAAIDGDPQVLLLWPVEVAVAFRDQLRDAARAPQPKHRADAAGASPVPRVRETRSRVCGPWLGERQSRLTDPPRAADPSPAQ